ncbi:nuclear protein 96-domain-containing protein [Lipomyces japonicus]|uniref:nuclear protein 96-domain-containing protein n=1 Tax=Lipomyces japonicus TaxID=56871 RepID=UPI0034CF04A8
MFGQSSGTGSAFGGFGSNNTNNSNQTGSLFGANNNNSTPAFGSTNTNTNTSAFGQPQSGFGTNNTASGTGIFGQNSNQSSGFSGFGNASRPSFGSSSTGFGGTSTGGGGLFGNTQTSTAQNSTSPFGGGGGFGSSTTNTANATSTSPFGQNTTGGGLFGSSTANKPAAGFGGFNSTSSTGQAGFGSAFGGAAVANTNRGTTTPFDPLREKEASSNTTNVFQSITCMPAYQQYSFEELREQDYAQGRRYGNSTGTGAFGKSTGFGSGTFGQPSAFGQTNNTNTASTGLFGGNTNSQPSAFGGSNAFGSNTNTNTNNSTGGLFGQKPATGGLFGSTNTAGTGLFGNTSANSNTATGGFGSGSTATPFEQSNTTNAFGSSSNAFGQTNQAKSPFGGAASTSGGFNWGGNTNATTPNNAATPTFGQTNTTTSPFGQSNTATGGGLFGSTNANSTSPFGQTNNTSTQAFGFGTNNNASTTQAPGFGGFGSTAAQSKPAFGTGFGTTNQTANTTSLFGQANNNPQQPQQQQQQAKPLSFGGFGQSNTTQPSTGGLFGGGAAPATQQGTSLFGTTNNTANTANTGLFGNTSTAQNNNVTGGLFGAKPQTSLFGNNQQQTNTGASLLGNNNTTNFGAPSGSSLFGANNQQPGNSLFGNNQGSILGNQQNQLQASIDQSPFGSNPLFNIQGQAISATPGPIATPISSSAQKKKPALIPNYKLSPRPPSSPRLRTSAQHTSNSFGVSGNGASQTISSSRSMLFDGLADKAILSSEAFSPRNDIRKLVIDRKVTEADLLSGGSEIGKIRDTPKELEKKVTFPDMKELNDRESLFKPTVSSSVNNQLDGVLAPQSDKPDKVNQPSVEAPKKVSTLESKPVPIIPSVSQSLNSSTGAGKVDGGGYWTSPSLTALSNMSLKELESVSNLKVGRKGYGEVSFNELVDLSTFASPSEVPGQIVIFGSKTCTVYPDDSVKPVQGKGLNVPATITLEKCYPFDKETRRSIVDPDHPSVPRHIERLQRMKDTEFVTYIVDSGTWVFKVKHFSIWGLLNEEDEYDSSSEPVKVKTEVVDYSEPMSVVKPSPYPVREISSNDLYNSVNPQSKFPGAWDQNGFRPEDTPLLHKFKGFSGQDSSKLNINSINSNVTGTYDEEEIVSDKEEHREIEVSDVDEDVVLEKYDTTQELVTVDQLDYDLEPSELGVPIGNDWIEQAEFTKNPSSLWSRIDQELKNKELDVSKSKKLDEYKFTFADLDAELFGGDRFFTGNEDGRNATVAPRAGVSPKFSFDGKLYTVVDKNLKVRSLSEFISVTLSELEFLDFYLAKSSFSVRDNGLPIFFSSNLTADSVLKFYSSVSTTDSAIINIWKLANILFDDLELGQKLFNRQADEGLIAQQVRKQNLSTFFEKLVEDSVSTDLLSASPEESVFVLLSGHQIEQACLQAVTNNSLHLATLIPLIDGDNDFRQDVKKQLSDWSEKQVMSEIPVSVRKVYELLSGNTNLSTGSKSSFAEDHVSNFCVSRGLDWKRAFGLRLWYETFVEDSIADAVHLYEQAYQQFDEVAFPALKNTNNKDILFELLRLYADVNYPIEAAILPSNITSNSLSFGVSWQLFGVLFRSKLIREDTEQNIVTGDKLCIDFASQLEGAGYWEKAVFVLLNMTDDKACEAIVIDIINRHVPDLNHDIELFLLNDLHVPKKIILRAKALYSREKHESIWEVDFLLEAQDWNEAHNVIMRSVGPEATISETLDELLVRLSRFEDISGISKWNVGGQIFLDYINLIKTRNGQDINEWWPKNVKGISAIGNSVSDSRRRLQNNLHSVDVKNLGFVSKVAFDIIKDVMIE